MKRKGFTLIELLISSIIMLVVIVGALSIYMRSNKITVDQQQITEVQHDIRNSMFFITRDVRMAGVGLPLEFSGYFLEGVDNDPTDTAAAVAPDRLKVMGNIEDPLVLRILNYQGSAADVSLKDYSLEENPYPDDFYVNKVVVIFPNPASTCRAAEVRSISHVTHSAGGTNEKLNFSPGQAPGINPPGGLSGTCSSPNDYDGGYIGYLDVKEYWLDVSGNYPGLTAGLNGYVGGVSGAGVLYMTHNGVHFPIAQNIENLQFQYNGDLDADGVLDGFLDWDSTWDTTVVERIREVRVIVLGRTGNRVVSVSGTPGGNLLLYRRPAIANSPASTVDDMHKRYLLESTANIRNMSLNIYNNGVR